MGLPTYSGSYLGPFAIAEVRLGVNCSVGEQRLGATARVTTARSLRNRELMYLRSLGRGVFVFLAHFRQSGLLWLFFDHLRLFRGRFEGRISVKRGYELRSGFAPWLSLSGAWSLRIYNFLAVLLVEASILYEILLALGDVSSPSQRVWQCIDLIALLLSYNFENSLLLID